MYCLFNTKMWHTVVLFISHICIKGTSSQPVKHNIYSFYRIVSNYKDFSIGRFCTLWLVYMWSFTQTHKITTWQESIFVYWQDNESVVTAHNRNDQHTNWTGKHFGETRIYSILILLWIDQIIIWAENWVE